MKINTENIIDEDIDLFVDYTNPQSEMYSMSKNLNNAVVFSILQFVEFLRTKEFNISSSSILSFCDMIAHFDILNRNEYMNISKSIFCSCRLEYDSFDSLFNIFFNIDNTVGLQLLIDKEKEKRDVKIRRLEEELKKELGKKNKETQDKASKILEEVLKARYKVYKTHKETLDETLSEEKKEIERLIKKSSESKAEQKMMSAFISLDKEYLRKYLKETNGNVNKIIENLEKILILNLENKNLDGVSEVMIQAAATVTKIESEFSSKNNSLDKELAEFKKNQQYEKDTQKYQIDQQIAELNKKLKTSKHKEQYMDGKSAVIELIKNKDKTIAKLGASEYESLLYYIKVNASKFRTRLGRSMRQHKNKQFDIKKTAQQSVKFGGIPMNFYYKKPVIKKYRLICVLDVSGSVSKYLEILAAFLFEINSVFNGGVSVYGFVSNLIDFSDVFKNNTIQEALQAVQGHRGYSSYEVAINDLYSQQFKNIDKNTVILYFGDARNNKNNPADDTLRDINKRARCSVWLNPEIKSDWDTGDSLASKYAECVNEVHCVNNVKGLIDFLNNFSAAENSLP